MSQDVVARIRAAIEDHGPISFAEFMEHALYGPGGFYERPPVGAEGHFVTSPHVHPMFGELMARELRSMWGALGRPEPFTVVEVGTGDGTLARQLLEHLGDLSVDYVAVERSPGARDRLAELPVRVVAELEADIDGGALLANELLDNLPFHRIRRSAQGTMEVRVGLRGERLVEVEVPSDPALAELSPTLELGEEAAVSVEALRFVDALSDRLRKGYALLIDYGRVDGPGGEVHGYRGQRVVADVLADPGSADITAGVDFSALARRASERGLQVFGPLTQRESLVALGFEGWIRNELARQGELLRSGAGRQAVRVWEGRNRATLLTDAAGLGRLLWTTLATPGLPLPRGEP